MSTIDGLAFLTTATGLLGAVLAVPLLRGKVPPNDFYGIRTAAAQSSEADWYRINTIGGRYFLVGGLLIALVGVAGFFLPDSVAHEYGDAVLLTTVLAFGVPALRLMRLKPGKSR